MGRSKPYPSNHYIICSAPSPHEELVEVVNSGPRICCQPFAEISDTYLPRASVKERLAHKSLKFLHRPGDLLR
ncbi:hypothetical protein D3C76_1611270 [compost metagenome]